MASELMDQKIEEAIRLIAVHFPPAEKLIKPTLLHSTRVGIYLANLEYSWEVCVGGLLHDTLEDTKLTKSEIKKKFGEHVLGLVEANTQNYGLPKEQQKEDLIRRCSEHSEDALIIKCADVIDNYHYRMKRGETSEIQRCVLLANLILKHKKKSYQDPIFENLRKTVLSKV